MSKNKNNKVRLPISPLQALAQDIQKERNGLTTSMSKQEIKFSDLSVDPSICIPWKYHDRDDLWLSPSKSKDIIDSIAQHGQKIPAIVRKTDDAKYTYEIIAGKRRWYACKHLGIELKIRIINADDQMSAIIMHLENKDRKDISEIERAISYANQINAGLFKSQNELCKAYNLKKSNLSKLITASKIIDHKNLISLLDDYTKISIPCAYELVSLLANSSTKNVITERLKYLAKANKKYSPKAILIDLLESLERSSKSRIKNYSTSNGKKIISVRKNNGKVLFTFEQEVKFIDKNEFFRILNKALLECELIAIEEKIN